MKWIDNFLPIERDNITGCKLHQPHLNDTMAISFLFEVSHPRIAVEIIAKMASMMDEIETIATSQEIEAEDKGFYIRKLLGYDY